MFLSQEASRNALNNRAEHGAFYKDNFSRLFEGKELAHFDTVDNLLRNLDYRDVEEVKTRMIRSLIRSKRIGTFEGYYLIAIDGTGVTSYDENDKGLLQKKVSRNGKESYLNIMLEAKLITTEGLSLSIASEPLDNNDKQKYEKQDCELKAFGRITEKIKKNFPRLPICLLLDGLYSNEPVMEICDKNGWKFISVLKNGSLSRLQEDIRDTEEAARIRFERPVIIKRGKEVQYFDSHYQCIEGVNHKGYELNWVECITPMQPKKGEEEIQETRFVYLTNLRLRKDISQKPGGIVKIVEAGRLRWKIENEGFNQQKNNGYHLHHKFSRHSVSTLHVYYILMQIAHLVNQLVAHSIPVVALLKQHGKLTLRYLWEKLRQVLEMCRLSETMLEGNKERVQIRLE